MVVPAMNCDISFVLCQASVSRDQAAAALYSANVPRPAASSLISLRRARHRPDLAGVVGAQPFRASAPILRTLFVFNRCTTNTFAAQVQGRTQKQTHRHTEFQTSLLIH